MKNLEKIYNSEISPLGKINHSGEEAFAFYQENEFPTKKTESWKDTDLKSLFREELFKAKNFDLNESFFKSFEVPRTELIKIVFVNGYFSEILSDKIIDDDNFTLTNLSEALTSHESELKEYLGKTAIHTENKFTSLNAAFAENGTFISVKKNKEVAKVIHLVYLTDGREQASFSQIRNLFVLGENSKATVLESYISLSNSRVVSNFVSEIFIKEGANLELYRYQAENESDFLITNTTIEQEANSQLRNVTFTMNGNLIRNDIKVKFNGKGCYAEVNGLSLADKRQHFDSNILINHASPNCDSKQLFKSLIDDEATTVFNGKVYVAEDAQKTYAEQSNRNILLTDTATSHSKPQLEIYADDVACAHGSTTGQIDTEALFYMQARGIGKQKARALLLSAFSTEVAGTVKNEAIKVWIENLISKRLGGRNIVRECKHVFFK